MKVPFLCAGIEVGATPRGNSGDCLKGGKESFFVAVAALGKKHLPANALA
jgi:hypothetical protein